MEIKRFYDLTAWKLAHELVLDIYKITKNFSKEEQLGTTSQLRRASSSITANIAEGFGRYHFKDKIKFYYQARGSATEVQDFLLLTKDLGYIKFEECKILGEKLNEIIKLTNGLINSINRNNQQSVTSNQ